MKIGLVIFMMLVLAVALSEGISAHHAMEYIQIESYETARKGQYVFHLHFDYMVDDQDNPMLDHWELTPGFSMGITNRLMFDVHTHFAKFGYDHLIADNLEFEKSFKPNGPSPFMEAVAGCLQYRLVEDWMLDVAVAAGMEIPFSRSEELLGSENNVYSGALIFGTDFGEHGNVTFNLCYEIEGVEDETFWGVGIKTPLSHDAHGICAGVEIMGSFEKTGDNWSILPGVYMPLGTQNVLLKTGIELGKGDGADITRANLTLMYIF